MEIDQQELKKQGGRTSTLLKAPNITAQSSGYYPKVTPSGVNNPQFPPIRPGETLARAGIAQTRQRGKTSTGTIPAAWINTLAAAVWPGGGGGTAGR